MLAGLGFMAMVVEVSRLGVDVKPVATQAAAGAIRSTLLTVYGLGFATVLAMRTWRHRVRARAGG